MALSGLGSFSTPKDSEVGGRTPGAAILIARFGSPNTFGPAHAPRRRWTMRRPEATESSLLGLPSLIP
jgi:hypothetical protein